MSAVQKWIGSASVMSHESHATSPAGRDRAHSASATVLPEPANPATKVTAKSATESSRSVVSPGLRHVRGRELGHDELGAGRETPEIQDRNTPSHHQSGDDQSPGSGHRTDRNAVSIRSDREG